jgi:methionine sulfoxide reductase heme-binding subunit
LAVRRRDIILAFAGAVFGIAYLFIADALKATEAIWLLTRSLGLLSIAALFVMIIIGELKLLGYSRFFRWHCDIAILTFYLALLHGFSAAFDRFKWGKDLSFTDYLGFNFSGQWMILLSMGTIAFYLIILVSVTSSSSKIKALGFGRWKLVHYLSYAVLAIVFVHSMLLGTDMKSGLLGSLLFPLSAFAFSAATGILVIRIFRKSIPGRKDVMLSIMLALLLSAAVAAVATVIKADAAEVSALSSQRDDLAYAVQGTEAASRQLASQALSLESQLGQALNVTSYLSAQIAQKAGNATVDTPVSGDVVTYQPVVIIPWEEYYGDEEEYDD